MERIMEIKEEIAMLQGRVIKVSRTLENNRDYDDAMEIMECLMVNIKRIKKLNRELQEYLVAR